MSTPHLLEMPDVAMSSILNELDFEAIQILRKVCRDFRNFIDDLKPDSKLSYVEIEMERRKINVQFDKLKLEYTEECLVNLNTGHTKKFTETENFMEAALKDMELVLKNQKSTLENFDFFNYIPEMTSFTESFGVILKSRLRPLQVVSFQMGSINQSEIMQVLPFLDPLYLKEVILDQSSGSNEEHVDLEEFKKLKQWKSAELMKIDFLVSLDNFSSDFGHFSEINLQVGKLKAADLTLLKNTFINSATIQNVRIRFDDFPENQPYGEPWIDENTDGNTYHYWYYSIPNSTKVLEIEHITNWCRILFSRWERNIMGPISISE